MLTSLPLVLTLKLLFMLLALAAALRCAGRVDQLRVWQSDEGLHALAAALAGAMLGAKLGFALQYPQLVFAFDVRALWTVVAGNSTPGAVAGAATGLMLALRSRAAVFGVALLPGLFAGIFILDLGAVVWTLSEAGFGAPARRWGVNFGDGVSRHPVMLYEAAAMAGLIWAARVGSAAALNPGLRISVMGSACFGIWFLLGFLKAPFGPVSVLEAVSLQPAIYRPGFTAEQWLCLLVVVRLMLHLMLHCGGHGWRLWQRQEPRSRSNSGV